MAEQTLWLDGQAKVPGIVEKICPKRHITQNQWLEEWNEMYLNDKSPHCYDFISDYECIFNHPFRTSTYYYLESWDNLQAAKLQGTHMSITNVAHFTKNNFADGIIESGGFRGGIKKYNENAKGDDVKAKFSWWSPIFGEDDIKLVRNTLGAAIQPFIAELRDQSTNEDDEEISSERNDEDGSEQSDENCDDDDQDDELRDQSNNEDDEEISSEENDEEGSEQIDERDSERNDEDGSEQSDENCDDDQDDDQDDLAQLPKQFATSEAFKPNAQRYGRSYFQYDINDLCDYYRVHFDDEVQFKILGTFSYKKQVMHAVLICSQENGNGLFKEYLPVLTPEEDSDNKAVVTRDNNGDWVWKPQATGTVIKRLPDQKVYPKYRRWEHVAFAFHIPEEWRLDPYMIVPELGENLHRLDESQYM